MRSCRSLAAALTLAGLLASHASAGYTYNIVQSQSNLNLTASGSLLGGALTIAKQQPSAITRYNGTIAVDYPAGNPHGGLIDFNGGSSINAVNTSGTYTPNVNGGAGSAAANYGLNATAPLDYVLPPIDIGGTSLSLGTVSGVNVGIAIRNLVLDVESTSPLAVGPGGAFDANGLDLSVTSGFADVNGSLLLKQNNIINYFVALAGLQALVSQYPDLALTVTGNLGTQTVALGFGTRLDLSGASGTALANSSLTDATVSYVNPVTISTLSIPVSINYIPDLDNLAAFLSLNLNISGQLVATAVVPEASSIVLGTIGSLGMGLMVYRRRKSS